MRGISVVYGEEMMEGKLSPKVSTLLDAGLRFGDVLRVLALCTLPLT